MRDDNNENKEGKQTLDVRGEAVNYISNKEARILELGPLTRPLLERKDYLNYFFADIRSTEEIRELYSGNKYLKETGISVEIEKIVEIDFVIKNGYKETFKGVEKFDYVIVSHVLEHIPNLLEFFVEIRKIMKENASLIIIYPDKRFSFDYFRTNTKFSDVYNVYISDGKRVASQVLDFYTNVIPENDPVKFWDLNKKVELFDGKKSKSKKNIETYEKVLKEKREDDVHYWPFSDFAFIKFLYESSIYNYLPYILSKFIPTQKNTQSFLVVLTLGERTPKEVFERALHKARRYLVNEFYHIKKYKEEVSGLEVKTTSLKHRILELDRKRQELQDRNSELESTVGNLEKSVVELDGKRQKLQGRNFELESRVAALSVQLEERSRIRYMVRSIVIKLYSKLKGCILSFPNKLLNKFKNTRKD